MLSFLALTGPSVLGPTNDQSDSAKAMFLSFQIFKIARLGDRHLLSYLTWYDIEVPSMIMLYLLGQTSAALHTCLGASGFDRRFGGLVAGKGFTVVFFHRLAWPSNWLVSAYPR
jgi:hypothetical protein